MKRALLGVAAIIVVWGIFGVVTWWAFGWTGQGPFGDTFGALNALFSGLALGGVILAIFLQRQELIYQREELRLTREQLRRSAEAQEGQNDILSRTALVHAYSSAFQALGGLGSMDHDAFEYSEEIRDKLVTLLQGIEKTTSEDPK